MNGQTTSSNAELANKIAWLVRERGWNQEDLVRSSNLNRQTVRQILMPDGKRRLRNATVSACARALGLSNNELQTLSLEQLQERLTCREQAASARRRLFEEATQPELLKWLARQPERANQLSAGEIDELLSIQATGGHLTENGVEHFVARIERKRELIHKIQAIAGTEYLSLLEQFVDVLYRQVRPYADRDSIFLPNQATKSARQYQ
jgi:hypothetical protein